MAAMMTNVDIASDKILTNHSTRVLSLQMIDERGTEWEK